MPERGRPRRRTIPSWARWNPIGAEAPWTVGLEEELVLVDPLTGGIASRIDDVLEAAADPLRDHLSAETQACVVELKTDPHATVGGAVADVARLRCLVEDVVREELGLSIMAAGMHPLATSAEVKVARLHRYEKVHASLRGLARREPTMALHVHVAVPGVESAVRALDGVLADLPILLALSSNSPYWHGEDSGLASARAVMLSMLPRSGMPRQFGRYANWVATIDALIRSRAIPGPGFVWWDVRLQPSLGTVEVRIMDAQPRLDDVGALAAIVQCLIRLHAEGPPPSSVPPELLAENRFLAARAGNEAQLLDVRTLGLRPMRGALAELLARCSPLAFELGCAREMANAGLLSLDGGYRRQRRLVALHGIDRLPQELAREFGQTAVPLQAAPGL